MLTHIVPPLVRKAPTCKWLCLLHECIHVHVGVPAGIVSLGLGLVVEDEPSELSCMHVLNMHCTYIVHVHV